MRELYGLGYSKWKVSFLKPVSVELFKPFGIAPPSAKVRHTVYTRIVDGGGTEERHVKKRMRCMICVL